MRTVRKRKFRSSDVQILNFTAYVVPEYLVEVFLCDMSGESKHEQGNRGRNE